MRGIGDIDLLLNKRFIGEMKEIMLNLGYTRSVSNDEFIPSTDNDDMGIFHELAFILENQLTYASLIV
ncbi:hypothetical protein [Paenibacillus terrae]|uniref:Uncharacterized protein n=1 Tax=Paenibacillus terrae TaxID=159743 RepID=A0A0D7X681_9BACL|nr:hypothetical protein [Paenibacillus terrae]KJD45532.1 hypothetical protein QD47_11030 [Paenibacillus terrae]